MTAYSHLNERALRTKVSAASHPAMPFRSKAQIRACFARKDPRWNCRQWLDETPNHATLPNTSRPTRRRPSSPTRRRPSSPTSRRPSRGRPTSRSTRRPSRRVSARSRRIAGTNQLPLNPLRHLLPPSVLDAQPEIHAPPLAIGGPIYPWARHAAATYLAIPIAPVAHGHAHNVCSCQSRTFDHHIAIESISILLANGESKLANSSTRLDVMD
jgi:hypothetical protein